ncbi:hypothetical protein MKX01_027883, partial [Papaver californicum]
MGRDINWSGVASTSGVVGGGGTPPLFIQREEHWRHFNNYVNVVFFGFVATTILIFMFLIMINPLSNSSEAVDGGSRNINHKDLDHQSQMSFNGPSVYVSLSFNHIDNLVLILDFEEKI